MVPVTTKKKMVMFHFAIFHMTPNFPRNESRPPTGSEPGPVLVRASCPHPTAVDAGAPRCRDRRLANETSDPKFRSLKKWDVSAAKVGIDIIDYSGT